MVEYSSQRGLPSRGYIDTAMTSSLPIFTAIISRIYFLDVANAKSLTFLAANFQVFLSLEKVFSASIASS